MLSAYRETNTLLCRIFLRYEMLAHAKPRAAALLRRQIARLWADLFEPTLCLHETNKETEHGQLGIF